MVTNYSVPRLSSKTPDSSQDKLTSAIEGVSGVKSVKLKPDSNQFEVTSDGNEEPKADDIMKASKKAGFDCESSQGSHNGKSRQNGKSQNGQSQNGKSGQNKKGGQNARSGQITTDANNSKSGSNDRAGQSKRK